MKLTQWFDEHTTPVRVGWYETATPMLRNTTVRWWDGQFWRFNDEPGAFKVLWQREEMAGEAEMTRVHKDRDLTMKSRPAGPGIGFTRNCFVCKKNKIATGGKTCKRTKMWTCAGCLGVKT